MHDPVRELFSSIRLDLKEQSYHDPEGKHFTGGKGSNSVWTEPLGKKVVVLDIDTRVPTSGNQNLNIEEKIDWNHFKSGGIGLTSHAITSHYLYAMIHGYDYKYIQAAKIPGHYDTWIRPHLFKRVLPGYQFIVHMDADAMVTHPEIPIEWMFNRWGVAEHTSFAMPHKTEELVNGTFPYLIPSALISANYLFIGKSISTDSRGVPVFDVGFVIVQNNDLTFEMLEAWANCTTEVRYPGCGQWKEKWSHEQRAFSEYIRYDFNDTPETFVAIPREDAMGYPGFSEDAERSNDDCKGNFIRHYMLGEGRVHTASSEIYA